VNIEKQLYLYLVPLAFLVMWFENGLESASFQIAFFIYLLVGMSGSIKVLAGGLDNFFNKRLTASGQVLYLIFYSTYWILTFGFNKKSILLLSPFIFAVLLHITITAYKRFFHANKT
jgi:hypothetical protein